MGLIKFYLNAHYGASLYIYVDTITLNQYFNHLNIYAFVLVLFDTGVLRSSILLKYDPATVSTKETHHPTTQRWPNR